MERLIVQFVQKEKELFPTGPPKVFTYGTAGFRDRADLLECVMFRAALIATFRSKCAQAAIGVVITASHNPEQDNGVKFVDTQGQMLIPEWERIAYTIGNAKPEELEKVALSTLKDHHLDYGHYHPQILIARDTRPSSEKLVQIVKNGLDLLTTNYTDYGLLTTPQLHYMVKCTNSDNQYGIPTEEGYCQKISKAFKDLMPQSDGHRPVLKLDAANGVGASRVKELMTYMSDVLTVEVYNDGSSGKLNYMCGADFVKASQVAPNGIPYSAGDCCVSFDGDADRIVFFYFTEEGKFKLLDGDKIASLMAMFIKEMLTEIQVELNMSVIQTAYSNGSSTKYISEVLKVPVSCAKTGVKYLQRMALEFDIGIFFEANGHGTVLYSKHATETIRTASINDKLSPKARECARLLLSLIDLTNQTTGDSISDMLIVQAILSRKQWSCNDWGQMYTELPNRQVKVYVKDREVITTTDAERQCVTPVGLQDCINELVSGVSRGRSFVRPSGTEDVVRIYAEAETQELTDQLAVAVARKVYELAGGVGEPPSL